MNDRQLALELGAPPPGDVRVRVARSAWDALPGHAREDMTLPCGGAEVAWSADGAWMVADVARATVGALAGFAEAHGVELVRERDHGR